MKIKQLEWSDPDEFDSKGLLSNEEFGVIYVITNSNTRYESNCYIVKNGKSKYIGSAPMSALAKNLCQHHFEENISEIVKEYNHAKEGSR